MQVVKTAIVAVLDVLGVSHRTLEEANQFLAGKKKIFASLNSKDFRAAMNADIANNMPDKFKSRIEAPTIRTFGDTIILVWNIVDGPVLPTLVVTSYWLRGLLYLGMKEGLLFRGAVGVGEVVEDENTLVGPGVFDAAAWHQAADWYGVMMTPSLYILEGQAFTNHDALAYFYIPYSVPMRDGSKLSTCAVAWPYDLMFVERPSDKKLQDPIVTLETVLEDIVYVQKRVLVPPGTQSKYYNAREFATFAVSKWKHTVQQQKNEKRLRTIKEILKSESSAE